MCVFLLRMLLSKLMKLISSPSAAFYTLAGFKKTLLSLCLFLASLGPLGALQADCDPN